MKSRGSKKDNCGRARRQRRLSREAMPTAGMPRSRVMTSKKEKILQRQLAREIREAGRTGEDG